MDEFKFYIPVAVRYSDLDAQWHVNHTRFITYMEQARFDYIHHLGLFDGKSFLDLKSIIADVHVTYLAPIELGQSVRVGTRTAKIGTKSIVYDYILENEDNGNVFATGEVVTVAYNYREQKTVPVSDEWRIKISEFEGKQF